MVVASNSVQNLRLNTISREITFLVQIFGDFWGKFSKMVAAGVGRLLITEECYQKILTSQSGQIIRKELFVIRN